MNTKRVLLGTLAYTLVTFPLAVVWHVVLFEEKYKAFGYFEGEPSFLLGFATILIQGFVLSFLFPFVQFQGAAILKGLKFSCIVGLFFWSSHVLAFIAKQVVASSLSFALLESFYLVLQFGIYGVLVGLIYKNVQSENVYKRS